MKYTGLTTIVMVSVLGACSVMGLDWKFRHSNRYLSLHSTLELNESDAKKVEHIYWRAKKLFFDHFEKNLVCDKDNMDPIDIYVVEEKILTDPKYFEGATSTNFGRFFGRTNIIWSFFGKPIKTPFKRDNAIYILPDLFEHPEYLAHELSHYYYDSCSVIFNSVEEEHIKVYKFQEYYKERVITP